MIENLVLKVRRKGFEGPFYTGMRGKLRFAFESIFLRQEFIFIATPGCIGGDLPLATGLVLHPVSATADVEPFREQLDEAYYPGYADGWVAPFAWGEQAVIGTVDGHAACFHWFQKGTREGYPTYYGRLLEREARLLRGGVAPSFRRRGLNTAMIHQLLVSLFAEGYERVFIECYKHNVPSVRTFLRLGFTPLGLITVHEVPGLRRYIRWESPSRTAHELRRVLSR